ncbi:MAG TPA: hypothetical protein VGR72_04475 [Candidatus Acidoferrales bacterium]|nr:hypothetical protein [Candidatus Acidoferrales bacterium]
MSHSRENHFMDRSCHRAIVLFFVAGMFFAAATVRAQSAPGDRIILPLELVAGRPATLGVLTPNGRVEADAKILLSNGDTLITDESGRAHFLAPAKSGILYAHVQGTEISAASDVRPGEGAADLQVKAVPRLTRMEGQLRIRGSSFEGDADRNQVRLGRERAFVLAASPVELVILPPPVSKPGAARLDLEADAQIISTQVTLIQVEATPQNILPEKKMKIAIHVFGTEESVRLELHNISPEIVAFAHGNNIGLRTSGGRDNTAKIQAKGLRTGEFSFSIRLAPEFQTEGIPVACDFLDAAMKMTPAAEKNLFENVLRKLKKQKPNVSAVRRELQRLTPVGHSRDSAALIFAAQEALFAME